MTQMLEWLTMGGYAKYIWSAYGLVCLVLVLNVFIIKYQQKRAHKKLRLWFKRQ